MERFVRTLSYHTILESIKIYFPNSEINRIFDPHIELEEHWIRSHDINLEFKNENILVTGDICILIVIRVGDVSMFNHEHKKYSLQILGTPNMVIKLSKTGIYHDYKLESYAFNIMGIEDLEEETVFTDSIDIYDIYDYKLGRPLHRIVDIDSELDGRLIEIMENTTILSLDEIVDEEDNYSGERMDIS